jgi:hypothetical protein
VYRPSNKECNAALGDFFERLENIIVDNLAPNKELILLGRSEYKSARRINKWRWTQTAKYMSGVWNVIAE